MARSHAPRFQISLRFRDKKFIPNCTEEKGSADWIAGSGFEVGFFVRGTTAVLIEQSRLTANTRSQRIRSVRLMFAADKTGTKLSYPPGRVTAGSTAIPEVRRPKLLCKRNNNRDYDRFKSSCLM